MADLLKIKEKVKERYARLALTGDSCCGPSVSFESGGGCCSGNNGAVLQPSCDIPVIFGIEVLASALLMAALLMAVIVVVVFTKGLRRYGGLVIGGIVGLDIFFLAFISGASMNPAR